MGVQVKAGRSWTNRVKLQEDHTALDPNDPVGAAAAGATVRILNSCRTMEDIGNVLAVAGSVSTVDPSSNAPVTVSRMEYTVLVNPSGKEFRTADTNKVDLLIQNGCTIDRIETEEIKG